MRFLARQFGWRGLNTRSSATGLPTLESVHLQDMRVVGRDLEERLGIVRVGRLSGNTKALDLDGANQYLSAPIDTRVWGLGTKWTVETALELDTAAGTQGILCAGHTTPSILLDVTGGNIRLRVWDSADTLTTVTVGTAAASLQTVQIARDGATISTRLDNAAAVTGAVSAALSLRTPVGDLRLGLDDGANYMNGTLGYVRVLSVSRSDHADRLIRLPSPRARHVMADYDMNGSGTLVYDRSRYENHLLAQNSPTEVASLCHNPAPIHGLSMGVDADNQKSLLVMAGGLYYLAEVD